MIRKVAEVPQLLVSVRNVEEVSAALAGGADWIDLKEPDAGPLAAVQREVASDVAALLEAGIPLSAALGELCEWASAKAVELLDEPAVSVVKLGLAGSANHANWQEAWLEVVMAATAKQKQLAAVIYADWQKAGAPEPGEVLSIAQQASCRFLLIDTFGKTAGTTFDHFSESELANILDEAKRAEMRTVLAGSLQTEVLNFVPRGLVDIVAVRGAVCRGDRTAQVDTDLVRAFREALWDHFQPGHITTTTTEG